MNKPAQVCILVPGRGEVPIFSNEEIDRIGAGLIAFYGHEPDQATMDGCVAALAEVRILSIGLDRVLSGLSTVGFSSEEGLIFATSAPPADQPTH
jgi:hypothetical protein